jgi:hypothetical protein
MKKSLVLSLLCSISSFLCFSQDTDTLKAVSGKFTTELNVNLFQGDLNFNNALQQIKFRYFLNNDLALRAGFDINSKKQDVENSNPYGNSPYKYENHAKTSTFGLNLGIEKHFRGTRRLSPYMGAEFTLTSKASSQKLTNGSTETDIKGAWQTITYTNNSVVTGYDENGYFQYGLNLICGFDYYFAKNFFAGYEFLFQFNKTNYKDIDVTVKGSTNNSPAPNTKNSESFLGPKLINGIRVGFVF